MTDGENERLVRIQERRFDFKKTENFTHGLHRYSFQNEGMVTAVSAQTWSEYLGYLSQLTDEDRLVVSPELMTFTGQALDEVGENQGIIEARVEELKERSKKHPQTLFLLGTPIFPEKGKPRNSVVFIQNGQLIDQTHKRSGASPEEYRNFELVAEEPAAIIPKTSIGLLICADLLSLSIFNSPPEERERRLRFFGKNNLIGTKPTFVHPKAKNLLVVSCWGIGGNRQWMGQGGANQYYLDALRQSVKRVTEIFPQLEAVIQVDRTPLMAEKDLPFTPTHPYNVFYQKKQEKNS